MVERLERGSPGACMVIKLKTDEYIFFMSICCKIMSVCEKNHVGLWKKSSRFDGKILSVCGKNHVGLWEKFVGQKTSMKNTHTCT